MRPPGGKMPSGMDVLRKDARDRPWREAVSSVTGSVSRVSEGCVTHVGTFKGVVAPILHL
jgi:hypothetical protein